MRSHVAGIGLHLAVGAIALLGAPTGAEAQLLPGEVRDQQLLDPTALGLFDELSTGVGFPSAYLLESVCRLGDVNGDGVGDVAVSAPGSFIGPPIGGAVFILFMEADGTVQGHQRIGHGEGGFGGTLTDYDYFGSALEGLGDLDGDGTPDLAVGAWGDDDGYGVENHISGAGSVWILFLAPDGTVKAEQKISTTQGGLSSLGPEDGFGAALAAVGDLDDDGVTDLAVCARRFIQATSTTATRLHILRLNADGTVKAEQRIDQGVGGFVGPLGPEDDGFGFSLASLGDLDGDGVEDLAVGAPYSDERTGAVWILGLASDGTVAWERRIDAQAFAPEAVDFGISLATVGDLDADGVPELSVGCAQASGEYASTGALMILFLERDGSFSRFQAIDSTAGNLGSPLPNFEQLGRAQDGLGDHDGDGVPDLMVWSRFLWQSGAGFRLLRLQGVVDDRAPSCSSDTSDAGDALWFTLRDDRPTEDLDGDWMLDPGEDLDGDTFIDADSGLASARLEDAANLQLLGAVAPGEVTADVTVVLQDPLLGGSGTLHITDQAGCETSVEVSLLGGGCRLVIGDGRRPGVLPTSVQVFETQVGTIEHSQVVAPHAPAEFLLPVSTGTGPWLGAVGIPSASGPAWLADRRFTAQVVLHDPVHHPNEPDLRSQGVDVTIRRDGTVLYESYGSGAIELGVEVGVDAQGRPVVRLPFAVPAPAVSGKAAPW